jgi:hypothetical protein
MTATITEKEYGWYDLVLTASHTDTVGLMSISLKHANCMQLNIQLRVTARLLDNLAFPTTSGRSIDVNTQGHVGLDFDETSGTLEQGVDIVGGLTAAMAASLALAAYDGPTGSEISAALTAIDAQLKAQAASTALSAYDPPTHAEMTAELAALENISVADILAGVVEGSLSVQDTLTRALAYFSGRILKSSTSFAYYSPQSVGLWTANITATSRDIT